MENTRSAHSALERYRYTDSRSGAEIAIALWTSLTGRRPQLNVTVDHWSGPPVTVANIRLECYQHKTGRGDLACGEHFLGSIALVPGLAGSGSRGTYSNWLQDDGIYYTRMVATLETWGQTPQEIVVIDHSLEFRCHEELDEWNVNDFVPNETDCRYDL